jgi:hypothetical protein
VLTGTYTSEVFDLGASARCLVYLQAEMVVTGAGTTWGEIAPDPMTWAQLEADTKSWGQLTVLELAPRVEIALYYGDSNPPTNVVEKQEILSAIVTSRYFKWAVTITDPTDALRARLRAFTAKFCVKS